MFFSRPTESVVQQSIDNIKTVTTRRTQNAEQHHPMTIFSVWDVTIHLIVLNCGIVAFGIKVFKEAERTKLDTVFPRSR